MDLGKVEIDFHVDYINKKVHLLDLNQNTSFGLFDVISPDLKTKFAQDHDFMMDVLTFDWICYGRDGIVCSYDNYNFKYMNPKLPYLHEPYLDEMEKRRHRYSRGM